MTDHTEAANMVPPPPPGWPSLHRDALHGLAGDIVRRLEPHTESDPVALLVDFLTAFGNAVGPGAHMLADGADHPCLLFAVVVGRTSKSRKGTARANVRRLMRYADETWAADLQIGGLSTGEGLISSLAEGNPDPRRFIFEPEFARVLTVMSRQGNTLSVVLRQTWDGEPLIVLTRQNPLTAEHHHISIVAHITEDELKELLQSSDAANGFANRFLFVAVRRSKLLPEGGALTEADYEDIGRVVAAHLEEARAISGVERSPDASTLWREMYIEMADDSPGMVGALTARAEAQLLRLSIIYALLDGSPLIEPVHLRAAKAVWDYCEASVKRLFASATGNATADRLLVGIRATGAAGLDLTGQRDLFSRHRRGDELQAARDLLEDLGLIVTVEEATRGKPRRISHAVEHAPWTGGDKGDGSDHGPG